MTSLCYPSLTLSETPARAPRCRSAIEVDNVSASYHVHLDEGWQAGSARPVQRSDVGPHHPGAARRHLRRAERHRARRDRPQRRRQVDVAANDLRRPPAGGGPHHRARPHLRTSAMGPGFNEDLTGRANITLGGLAIGLDEDRLDELSERSRTSPSSASTSTCRCRRTRAACGCASRSRSRRTSTPRSCSSTRRSPAATRSSSHRRPEVVRALRRRPHDRARHPRAQHHPLDGDHPRSGCTRAGSSSAAIPTRSSRSTCATAGSKRASSSGTRRRRSTRRAQRQTTRRID